LRRAVVLRRLTSNPEVPLSLDVMKERGIPLDRQQFTWKELVRDCYSKLDADAFTRVRVILMNGQEMEAIRFQHACARMNKELQLPLARIRRVEHHQATLVNWLNPADQSPLETTIGYEQVAIEVTAHLAQHEPDPYLAQVYRFGLLEDFDHLYRYSALLDRVEGKDANAILQSYTDVIPGRPTMHEHRAPDDDLREHYDRTRAHPLTKLNALVLMAGEQQTHNYYMNLGPTFADPVARALYAEIASIEQQHVTQYESIIDPTETWLEKWMLHEASEVWSYWSCLQQESDPRVKAIWERFLEYELGHLHHVRELFERFERRDAASVLPATLPEPLRFESQREFVRETLAREVDLRANGKRIVSLDEESPASLAYRDQLNSEGSPTETVAGGYRWRPGTELAGETASLH
jgi:rubrerythrin